MITTNIKKAAGTALLSGGLTLIGFGLASGTAQAFNPQPEPPTKPSVSVQTHITSPTSIGGVNSTSPKVAAGGVRGCDGSV